jgi:hypothetical protein
MHLAPRHTERRSSSSNPAARHNREQVAGEPPRPPERAEQSPPRPRRGQHRDRRQASGPRRREWKESIVGSFAVSGKSRVAHTAYRTGDGSVLDGGQYSPLLRRGDHQSRVSGLKIEALHQPEIRAEAGQELHRGWKNSVRFFEASPRAYCGKRGIMSRPEARGTSGRVSFLNAINNIPRAEERFNSPLLAR